MRTARKQSDSYRQHFAGEFTEASHGKAHYPGLKDLGHLVSEDYKKNRCESL